MEVGEPVSAYIKIGLFSKIAQVTIRALRHYDELGLLKPAYIEPSTNYRYYTYGQLIRLNQILVLKDAGFALEQIASMIATELTVEEMKAMMHRRKDALVREIQEATYQLHGIDARLEQLEKLGAKPKYEVVIKQVPALVVAAVRRIVPMPHDMPKYRCRMFDELNAWLDANKLAEESEYVFYHMTEFVEENFDIEAAVSLAGLAGDAIPSSDDENVSVYRVRSEATVASLVYQGSFMGVGDALLELFAWLGRNGYSPTGAVRELHLFGRENDHRDFNHVLVELQVPVSR